MYLLCPVLPHNLLVGELEKEAMGGGEGPLHHSFLESHTEAPHNEDGPHMMLNRQMWETFKCLAELTCFVWRFRSSRHKVFSKVIAEAASAEIRLLKP